MNILLRRVGKQPHFHNDVLVPFDKGLMRICTEFKVEFYFKKGYLMVWRRYENLSGVVILDSTSKEFKELAEHIIHWENELGCYDDFSLMDNHIRCVVNYEGLKIWNGNSEKKYKIWKNKRHALLLE